MMKIKSIGANALRKASIRLLLFALAATASGCNVFPEAGSATLHSLSAAPAGSPQRCAVSFSIRDLRLAGYLDRAEIITDRSGSQLQMSSLQLWAAPLKDELRRTIGRSVAERWSESRLVNHPWRFGETPDLAIDIAVEQLEPVAGNLAIQIDWQLLQLPNKSLSKGSLRRALAMPAAGAAGAVAAINQTTAALADAISAQCFAKTP